MSQSAETFTAAPPSPGYQLLYFSELLKHSVRQRVTGLRLGKPQDMVFRLAEPYPEAVGVLLDNGWGRPTELVPWEKVASVTSHGIEVEPPGGDTYPPFVDQPGWMLLNEHLIGRTILDMNGRGIEVVNDVQLLESKGRVVLVYVDISFNGFLRKWGVYRLVSAKEQLIPWKYVQPLSVEDVGSTDSVALSITRAQIADLPEEDLADALEELSGEEQQAVFSALDSEKAADVLSEAEPRAQRQLIANLRLDRARTILSEMSPQRVAALFTILPHDNRSELMKLLTKEQADEVSEILSLDESVAESAMSDDFIAVPAATKVGEILRDIRASNHERDAISYVYLVDSDQTLIGVVDLRDLMLASDEATLGELMVETVVCAGPDDAREDLSELFDRYHYRRIPIVDDAHRLMGVVAYKDVKGPATARQ
jgi:CBS domain-containing protein